MRRSNGLCRLAAREFGQHDVTGEWQRDAPVRTDDQLGLHFRPAGKVNRDLVSFADPILLITRRLKFAQSFKRAWFQFGCGLRLGLIVRLEGDGDLCCIKMLGSKRPGSSQKQKGAHQSESRCFILLPLRSGKLQVSVGNFANSLRGRLGHFARAVFPSEHRSLDNGHQAKDLLHVSGYALA